MKRKVYFLVLILIFCFSISAQADPFIYRGTINNTLNVKDYGAKGTGTDDDTAAIISVQSAYSAGDTIYFPRSEERRVGKECRL